MKRLIGALTLQFALQCALAIQAFPIVLPPPLAEGAKARDIRVDTQNLYIKTSSNEIIRVDKFALLEGKVSASTATPEQWASIKEPTSELVFDDRTDWSDTWRLAKQKVRVNRAYCAEGREYQNSLQIGGRKIDTGLEGCMALFEPLHFDGKLWFRTNYPGEYGDSPGVGVLIFDVAKKRRVAKITRDLVGGDAGHMRVDADLNGVWVVNDRAIHFFDNSLMRKALAYYSEQFDPTGQNWSVVVVSNERRNHNQFAAAARILMTPLKSRNESDDVYAARLAQNRWVTADGIAVYTNAVARLTPRSQSNFSIRYDDFERRYFPFWAGMPMTQENGGSEFKAASRLLSCLYEKAGSPDWNPRDLVMNIASVAEGLNWAEFQLYEPKCIKRRVTP